MNQVTKPAQQRVTIANFLSQKSFSEQLKAVLPKTLTPERMVRIALTEIRMNPKLAECDPFSYAGAIMRCAQMGLEPGSERQHVHLIPFENKKMNRMECQVIVGYRGFLALAAKNNVYIESGVVFENDNFEFEKGMDTKCKLIPCMDGESGKVKGAYAMARVCLPDGTIIFIPEFMSVNEINKIMVKSKGSNYDSSPWKTDYEAMARKSAIRRLFKYVPISEDIDSAINTDELAERDAQDNAKLVNSLLDTNAPEEPIDEPTSKADSLASMLEDTEEKKEG